MSVAKRLAIAPDNSFIGGGYIDDLSVCERLIDLFKNEPNKVQGAAGDATGERIFDPAIKDSIDFVLAPNASYPAYQDYLKELQKIVQQYIMQYPLCNEYAPWTIVEPVNIQYYKPGGGYKKLHTERFSAKLPFAARHLAFMTYLNDVDDGGGTEFPLQNFTASARRGLTLIWPTDWTHTHRGIVSATQQKYIITGWFSFTR